MARADLPSFDVRPVWDDPVPPERHDFMRLVVERMLLERAHQQALPRRFGLVQHLLIEIDRRGVVEISVLLGAHRARLVFAGIEYRAAQTLAIAFDGDIKAAIAQTLEPRPSRQHTLRDLHPDLAPLVDQPDAEVFERLVDTAVQQFETQPL